MPSTTQKPSLPKPLSPGECEFALHCQVHGLKPQREVELIPGRKFRFDFYFPEKDLAIEIDGGTQFGMSRHSRGEGYERDCRKLNAAALIGIKVLRYTTAMVKTGEAINDVLAILKG